MTITWHDLLRPGDAIDFFSRSPLPPFDPDATGYSQANAWWLAELSRLVYRRDVEEERAPRQPSRTSFLVQANLRQRRFFASSATGTQAFLVECDRPSPFAVLVFRGTEQGPEDFLTNIQLRAKAIAADGARAHEGFVEAIDSVWPDIAAELATLACPVFYTGHSLGAALATLAAARRQPRAVYTFGSPLVGNQGFVSSLGAVPVFRVVHDADAVTVVPPELLGYQHAGVLHLLKPTTAADPLLWLRRLVFLVPPKRLADHAPINYVRRV